jgi:hypothetical protein
MFERYTEKTYQLPAEERTSGTQDKQSRAAMETLRENFAPLLERLTPEVEPITVFSLQPPSKETPQ